MLKPKVNMDNYVWVISEIRGEEEAFLGMSGPEGHGFIPVTASREDAESLVKKLPPAGPVERQVEATHKEQIIKHAQENDFHVYLVDGEGKLLRRLGEKTH